MIDQFRNGYVFLSNFYPCKIRMNGVTFASAEHAYQWHKLARKKDKEAVRQAKTPQEAREIGQRCVMLDDWEQTKLGIMLEILIAKFKQNPELALKLKATAPQELVEGNNWGDRYWGKVKVRDQWEGDNNLGRLLMLVRDNIV